VAVLDAGLAGQTAELKRFYPTTVLVTGFDIIFFWVARMMMMGLHFMKEVPFKDVYIHALVRDEKGAKMSKSKGNVMDPLELIEQLRRRRAALHAGRDGGAGPRHQARDQARVEGYRNFATKIWNAARFAEMNGAERDAPFDPKSARETLNKWISAPGRKGDPRSHRSDRSLQVQRGRGCCLPLRLVDLLRLVRRTLEAAAHGADGAAKSRDAGVRLRARRDHQAAAPLHALHHRGTLAEESRELRAGLVERKAKVDEALKRLG
jgi:hypothetical protein